MKLPHTLLRRLAALLSSLSYKSSLACCAHVYFTPAGQHIVISASDLEFQIHWPLAQAVFGTLDRPASCPLHWFIKIAKAVRKDGHLELRLTSDGHTLCAYPSTGPSARSPERSLPIADMPPFVTTGFTRGGWLSLATLQHIVTAKDFISTDETRYVLMGAFISATGHCVATDGRRLCHRATPGTVLPQDIILPVQRFAPLLELAGGLLTADGRALQPATHERLAVWLPANDADKMLVQAQDCLAMVKLIDGNYPNWRQVIPREFSTLVDLDEGLPQILRAALQRSPNRKDTRLTLTITEDGITRASLWALDGVQRIDLVDPDFVAGRHVISMTQPFFSIHFNVNLILPALETTSLRLRLTDEISPGLTGDPAHGETVLMPLRSNDPVAKA